MSLREAAGKALEALESLQGGCTDSDDGTVEAITVWCPEIIEALREALAEAEKAEPAEPVAWRLEMDQMSSVTNNRYQAQEVKKLGGKVTPLYARPPAALPGSVAPDMYDALSNLLERYVDLVNCGDCGKWNPEREEQVIAARAVLAAAKAEPTFEDPMIESAWKRFTAGLQNPSPLTDEEILELWSPSLGGAVQRPILGRNKILAFARAVMGSPPAALPELTDEDIEAIWFSTVKDMPRASTNREIRVACCRAVLAAARGKP